MAETVDAAKLVGVNLGYAYSQLPVLNRLLVDKAHAEATPYARILATNATIDQLAPRNPGLVLNLGTYLGAFAFYAVVYTLDVSLVPAAVAVGLVSMLLAVEVLREADIETHLVMSKWAVQTLEHETKTSAAEVRALATVSHDPGNMGAAISSGSFITDGMIIAPCSMRSLGAIAHGN